MKAKLVKYLRKIAVEKFLVKHEEGRWRLYSSPKMFREFSSEESLRRELQSKWHDEAAEFLFRNKNKLKRNKTYIW